MLSFSANVQRSGFSYGPARLLPNRIMFAATPARTRRSLFARLLVALSLFTFAALTFGQTVTPQLGQTVTVPGTTPVGTPAAPVTVPVSMPQGGVFASVHVRTGGVENLDFTLSTLR